MEITLRDYQGPEDLRLQYDFWEKVTAGLPWAWKPTTSPSIFHEQREFDPRTRCFAFEGDRLVGYMGFTGSGDFVSLGYPWVLESYEGELQERLFERVYGFAASPSYGGKTFAQRFRLQWDKQIDFFRKKGFEVTGRVPIYGCAVQDIHVDGVADSVIEIQDFFDFEKLSTVAEKSPLYGENDLSLLSEYFKAVAFDFSASCYRNGYLTGYAGVAYRHDTGYGEIISAAFDEADAHAAFGSVMFAMVRKLRQLGAKTISLNGDLVLNLSLAENMGLSKVSESVMMMKINENDSREG